MAGIPKHLRKRLIPPVYFMVWIVAIRVLHKSVPIRAVILSPYTWLGIVVLLSGLALAIAGNRLFVTHKTALRPFEEATTLVQTGVYSISRNPMYLGLTLVGTGLAIFQGTASALMIVPLFPLLIDWLFIRTEEALLSETFGQEYSNYMARVRRWL